MTASARVQQPAHSRSPLIRRSGSGGTVTGGHRNGVVPVIVASMLAGCAAKVHPVADIRSGTCYRDNVSVRFVGPEPGTRDRQRLDPWCPGVGDPVLRDASGGATPADSLLVLSWNVGIGKGRIAELVEEVRATFGADQPFVLLVQETYSTDPSVPLRIARGVRDGGKRAGPEPAIGRTADSLDLSLVYAPSMRNTGTLGSDEPSDRGNAVLSNLELDAARALELPFELQRRVAVNVLARWVRANGDTVSLDLTSTHFDTHGRRPFAGLSFFNSKGRKRQAEGLLRMLPATSPALLAGDLNTWLPGFATWDWLEPAIPTLKLYYPLPVKRPPGGTAGGGTALDHMMFRVPADWFVCYARLEGGRRGSDHHPLVGWIVPQAGPDRREAGGGIFQCQRDQ